jgi:hypothetical protein
MPKIVINGQSYDSPDDMPANIRETYQKAMEVLHDSDGNGIPDLLEGKPVQNISTGPVSLNLRSGSQIILGNKIFTDPNDLPPEARVNYDQAIAKIGPLLSDVDGNGIPDMLEGKISRQPVDTGTTTSTTMEIPSGNTFQASPPMIPQEPPQSVIQEESTNYGVIAMIMLVALVLVGALGAGVYIFVNMAK